MVDDLHGKVIENMPLNRHTTWRVGGPAKKFFSPKDVADLAKFLKTLPHNEKVFWLGLGSNLLIRDAGISATVISTLAGLSNLELKEPNIIRAESGVSCAKLARFSARLGLSGGEFWAGIPGSVGGALAMNAGCYGSETWQHVVAVETMTRDGQIHLRDPKEYHIGYREVVCPEEECFIAGYFKLENGDKEIALENIRQLLEKRATSQPTGEHNCGSVFRNPPGDHAGRLIENCQLKGFEIGGALVSPKHANFIINRGDATAKDIEQLIQYVSMVVKEKHGVELIQEVKIVGDEL